jgi:hypothetical protein
MFCIVASQKKGGKTKSQNATIQSLFFRGKKKLKSPKNYEEKNI